MRATRLQAALAERAVAFFDRYDYLACPVTQVDPFPIEQEYATEIDGVPMGSYIEWMRSNSRISVLCCPAISVPIGFSAPACRSACSSWRDRSASAPARGRPRARGCTGLADRSPRSRLESRA